MVTTPRESCHEHTTGHQQVQMHMYMKMQRGENKKEHVDNMFENSRTQNAWVSHTHPGKSTLPGRDTQMHARETEKKT